MLEQDKKLALAAVDALLVEENEEASKESCPIIGPDQSKGEPNAVNKNNDSSLYSDRITPLFNAAGPQVELQREKPWHRLAVRLKATGMTDVEIAQELDVTPAAVRIAYKQPWASDMLLRLLHQTGDQAIKRLHDAAEEAAQTLIHVMQTAENKETQRKAANDILDRKYGKPNQPYSVAEKAADQYTDEELAKMAQAN